jgi:hypothetical protein
MKTETTPKKVWQKPEVQDLDVKNTASGTFYLTTESMFPNDSPDPS